MRGTLAFALAALISMLASSFFSSVASADPRELIGQPAPSLRARPLDSDAEVGLSSYRGRVVLLAFVASWCPACRRLSPELEALYEAHRAQGFEVIGVSHEPRDRLRAHVARRPRAFPILQCTGRTAVRYQAVGLPTLFLVDRRGRIRATYQGASDDTVARLRRDVARLVEATPE